MIPFRSAIPDPPVRRPATRMGRKVALCGSHSASLEDAPWNDPTWEFWGHASSRGWYAHKMDRYFDLHPKSCWTRGGKKGAAYPRWLSRNTIPIYMRDHFPEVPASIKYPRGRIFAEFSYAHRRRYFANHAAWMIALAILEGVDTIGLYGINYSIESEYMRQRGSAEYWLGQCDGRGINVILPEQCSLLREPELLYGYESHDEQTGILRDEYKRKVFLPQETIIPAVPGAVVKHIEPPEAIRAAMEAEEREHPRPDWALGPLPTSKTDGDAQVSLPVSFSFPETQRESVAEPAGKETDG